MKDIVIWKPVPGYEGLYNVSNLGEIFSLPRVVFRPKKKQGSDELVTQPVSGRTLIQSYNGNHMSVRLCKNGVVTTKKKRTFNCSRSFFRSSSQLRLRSNLS